MLAQGVLRASERQTQGEERRPLVERGRELALIRAHIDAAAAGAGSLVIVDGAAGVGKTALLEHAVALAHGMDIRVASARGRVLERALSFGIVRQLFEGVLRAAQPGERALLLDGPASAAGDLLEGRRAGVREGDELELVHGVHWFALNLADPRPLAIVVDDLHWADRSSLAFLLYLAQRVENLPIALVAAARPGDPDAAEDLLERFAVAPGARRVRPAPLSHAAIEELVRQRFPDADAEFCRLCATSTGGNPFLARELLRVVEAEDLGADAASVRRAAELAADSVLPWTRARLNRLGAGARAIAEAVAILGDGAELRHVAALAGLPAAAAADAADALATADVLAQGEPLQFSHPLIATAVHDGIGESVRGERHRAAAKLRADDGAASESVAAQLLAATPAGDPWAVEQLREAARFALDRGAADSAVRYLSRAAEEPPAEPERGRVLAEAAQAQALVGDPEAIARMESAVALLTDPRERAEALYRFGWMLYNTGRLTDSVAVFARGRREYGDRADELAVRLQTAHYALQTITVDGAQRIESAPEDDGRPVTDRAEREVLTRRALMKVFASESVDEAVELAERAIGGGAMVAEDGVTLTFAVAASCLIWSDALGTVDAAIDAALAECRRRGTYAGAAYVMFGRSWLRYWQGRVSESAADSGVAIEAWRGGWGGQIPLARYWHALALLELGRVDDAHAAVHAAGVDEEATEDTYVAYVAEARACVALARGDVDAARRQMRRVEDVAGQIAIFQNPNGQPWHFQGAIIALQAGDLDDARRLVSDGLEAARRFGAPRAIGMGLRASALIDGGDGGLDLLAEAVHILDRSPSVIERIRALVDLGAALRRAGRRAEAREPLRHALDLAARTGALALRERARDELEAAGARPRRDTLSGSHALTPSERRVVELAAAGRTNPEIAHELFVVRKTVEYHLSAAYRKLGVSSRDELSAALGG